MNLEGWTSRGVPSKPYYFHCAAAQTAVDFFGLHSILRGVRKKFSEAKVAIGKTEDAEESWRAPCEPFCNACNSLAWTARMSWAVLFSVDTIFLYRSQKWSLACFLARRLCSVVIRFLDNVRVRVICRRSKVFHALFHFLIIILLKPKYPWYIIRTKVHMTHICSHSFLYRYSM